MPSRSVIFGGRLGEYKYYDMDKVIEGSIWTRRHGSWGNPTVIEGVDATV